MNLAVNSRIEQHNLARQIFHEVHIHPFFPSLCPVFADAMLSHTMQGIKANAEQFLSLYVHEVASNIQLEHITLLLIVLTLLSDVLLQSFDAIVSATASSWQEKARRQSLILMG